MNTSKYTKATICFQYSRWWLLGVSGWLSQVKHLTLSQLKSWSQSHKFKPHSRVPTGQKAYLENKKKDIDYVRTSRDCCILLPELDLVLPHIPWPLLNKVVEFSVAWSRGKGFTSKLNYVINITKILSSQKYSKAFTPQWFHIIFVIFFWGMNYLCSKREF